MRGQKFICIVHQVIKIEVAMGYDQIIRDTPRALQHKVHLRKIGSMYVSWLERCEKKLAYISRL